MAGGVGTGTGGLEEKAVTLFELRQHLPQIIAYLIQALIHFLAVADEIGFPSHGFCDSYHRLALLDWDSHADYADVNSVAGLRHAGIQRNGGRLAQADLAGPGDADYGIDFAAE